MNPRVETIETDRFTMDYLTFGGGGNPLVILPGLSAQSVMLSAEAVAQAYRLFAQDYTVYLLERRNELPEAYPISEMARDTAEALMALGLNRVNLYGVSQGGMIALNIAVDHPEMVEKLVLGSTAARVPPEGMDTLANWASLARAGKAEELYLAFGAALYPKAVFEKAREALIEGARAVTDGEMRRFAILAEGINGFDLTEELGKIACPVLVLGSRDDGVLGGAASLEIARRLEDRPDCELYMYDGYGHAAYDLAPDYKERIEGFLRQ